MVQYFKKRGLSIIDLLNTVFVFVVFIFYFVSLPRNPYIFLPVVVLGFSLVLIWLAVFLRKRQKINTPHTFLGKLSKIYLDFYPLIFMFVIFESFFMILPYFNPHDYDSELAQMDFSMFGVYPTVWIEQWVRPWLTDLMYIVYFIYYPLPLVILVYLYKKKWIYALDRSVFILLVVNYGAYITYFFVPAMGPRFYEPVMHLQTKALNGIFFAVPIRDIISVFEPNKFDAFPSLHIATSLTTLLIMAKYNKKMFAIFIPVIAGIWIAVIYCRFHYVVDMIAGIVWTVVAFYSSGWFYDRWIVWKLPPYFKLEKDV
jgi:membrane-associated phospholipid phosphatase